MLSNNKCNIVESCAMALSIDLCHVLISICLRCSLSIYIQIYNTYYYISVCRLLAHRYTHTHTHIIHDTCAVPYNFTYPNMMKHICIHTTHTYFTLTLTPIHSGILISERCTTRARERESARAITAR